MLLIFTKNNGVHPYVLVCSILFQLLPTPQVSDLSKDGDGELTNAKQTQWVGYGDYTENSPCDKFEYASVTKICAPSLLQKR